MKSVSREIEAIVKGLGLHEKVRLYTLRRDFRGTIPPPLSDHLFPVSLTKGTLLVYVDSTQWLYEVRNHTEEIRKRLSAYGVRNVRFKLGRVYRKRERPVRHDRDKVEIPDSLRDYVDAEIKDPAVRDSILSAITASINRPRRP